MSDFLGLGLNKSGVSGYNNGSQLLVLVSKVKALLTSRQKPIAGLGLNKMRFS